MPKLGYKKCINCDEWHDNEGLGFAVERGDDEGKPVCDTCYSEDGSEPVATIVLVEQDGDKTEAVLGNYALYGDHHNAGIIEKYADTIKYISTDGWRGHHDGKAPNGWVEVINTWFCGFDGHNMTNATWELERRLKEDDWERLPCEILFSFLRTSNVFSTGLEVYVPSWAEDDFKTWLNLDQ